MSRCWTCGKTIGGTNVFTCTECKNLSATQDVREKINDLDKYTNGLQQQASFDIEKMSSSMIDAFESIEYMIKNNTESIVSVIEWGIDRLEHHLIRSNQILSSINTAIRNPLNTKAKEQREIAFTLARRGILDQSEKRYRDAIADYPLDFQMYYEYALVLVRSGKSQQALSVLDQSFPHAPKIDNIDFKSHVLRFKAHIYFCQNEVTDALRFALEAMVYSPEYKEIGYDVCRYIVSINDTKQVNKVFIDIGSKTQDVELILFSTLQHLIKHNPLYYSYISNDKILNQRPDMVKITLENAFEESLQEKKWYIDTRVSDWRKFIIRQYKTSTNSALINTIRYIVNRGDVKWYEKSYNDTLRYISEKKAEIDMIYNNDSYIYRLRNNNKVKTILDDIEKKYNAFFDQR